MLALRVDGGDPDGFTVLAKLKPSTGFVVPDDSVAAVATFAAEFDPAAGSDPAFWRISIGADAADALPRGRYIADALFSLDGEPIAVDGPVWIILQESVSG